MNQLNIHNNIKEKLRYFQSIHKIPNIIFHGPSGSGKRTILNEFINNIYYHDRDKIKSFVMYVNCAHGKGIKFIRDDLKFFAKTHINSNGGDIFKSIILLNADKLTMDAQSALRRCIELFSHNTRFFIVVEDKYNLLKPILSRFCEIYVPEPVINGAVVNLYKYTIAETFHMKTIKNNRHDWLKKEIIAQRIDNLKTGDLMAFCEKIYEKGYSSLDVIQLLENPRFLDQVITSDRRYEMLITFSKVRKEFRNEKLMMLFIFNYLFVNPTFGLENISFM
jgi:DNA polymerase III delta prime subunit